MTLVALSLDVTCLVGLIVHHEDDLILDEFVGGRMDGPHSIARFQIFDATLFTRDELSSVLAVVARGRYGDASE